MEQSSNIELTGADAVSANNTVVIVHADPALEHVLSTQFRQRGFSPVLCSARTAMREVGKLQPVAFVLDWDVAEIDCLDLMESVSFGRNAKVLVCSRFDRSQELASSELQRQTQWLRTPCTWEHMSAALDNLLSK